MVGCDQGVRDLEDQIARPLVENAAAMLVAEPVEDREADAKQRYAQPLRGLPAMGVTDQEIDAGRALLEVAEIAGHHFGRHGVEDGAVRRRGDRHGGLGAHFGEEGGHLVEEVRFGGDGHLAAAEVEVTIQHGVLQLGAATAYPGRHRPAGQAGEQRHEAIGGGKAGQRRQERVGKAGLPA